MMSAKFLPGSSKLVSSLTMKISLDFMEMMGMLWSILVNSKLTKLLTLSYLTLMLLYRLDQKLLTMSRLTNNSSKKKRQEQLNNGMMSNNSGRNQIPLY